jgi:23S rRNA pseudouridine1911/1915/1917 synthase
MYGRAREDAIYGVERQMLHAMRLTLFHPRSSKKMTFIAPLPDDMKKVLVNLSGMAK